MLLLYDPRGALFLMNEEPMYSIRIARRKHMGFLRDQGSVGGRLVQSQSIWSHRFPLLFELTEVPLLLGEVPLSTFVSVGSAREAKGMVRPDSFPIKT